MSKLKIKGAKAKKPKRSTVKNRLWRVVSQYIRQKSSVNGMCECVTCNSWHPIAETDAGHFLPRTKGMATYYVEENIACQCRKCNRFLEGNTVLFYKYMLDMYGQEKIDELIALSETTVKFTVNDLLNLENEYKENLKQLNEDLT